MCMAPLKIKYSAAPATVEHRARLGSNYMEEVTKTAPSVTFEEADVLRWGKGKQKKQLRHIGN